MYPVAPLLLFLVVARSSAAPTCENSMSCLMPVLNFVVGPEGVLMARMDSIALFRLDYTEQQLNDFCQAGRLTAECYSDIFERCGPFADLRDFFGNMAALMKGCDDPGFYNKARSVLQCTATFNQTGKINACYNAAVRTLTTEALKISPTRSPWTGQFDRTDLTRRFSSGKILDAMCCSTKFYKTCTGAEINDKCGADVQLAFDELQKAVLTGFLCGKERLSRCSPLTDPLPEDYRKPRESIFQYAMDFTEMIRASLGGLSSG